MTVAAGRKPPGGGPGRGDSDTARGYRRAPGAVAPGVGGRPDQGPTAPRHSPGARASGPVVVRGRGPIPLVYADRHGPCDGARGCAGIARTCDELEDDTDGRRQHRQAPPHGGRQGEEPPGEPPHHRQGGGQGGRRRQPRRSPEVGRPEARPKGGGRGVRPRGARAAPGAAAAPHAGPGPREAPAAKGSAAKGGGGQRSPRSGGRPVPARPPRRSPTALLTWGAVALVLIIVVVLVVVKITGSSTPASVSSAFIPTSAQIVDDVTSVPTSVYDKVGISSSVTQVIRPHPHQGPDAAGGERSARDLLLRGRVLPVLRRRTLGHRDLPGPFGGRTWATWSQALRRLPGHPDLHLRGEPSPAPTSGSRRPSCAA